VETLVAITVIATAITVPFYAVQQALNLSRTARDQLIASSLAQEGVEYVRSIRDRNYLYTLKTGSPRSWLYSLDGSGSPVDCEDDDCVVDPVNGSVSNTVTPLYLRSDGVYVQSSSGGAALTRFTRTIRLSEISETEETLMVTVSWTIGGTLHTIEITENLRDWL